MRIPGTQGYAEQATALFERYEAVPFEKKHQALLPLLPDAPTSVLDIGTGTGADAAWFASRGDSVLAVEPVDELRAPGIARHRFASIEWLDDSLPELQLVAARRQRFEVVMLSAVWMHLDEPERRLAMPVVASLLAAEGVLVVSLRHGPVPSGRRMFEVTPGETAALARAAGLRTILDVQTRSVQAANIAAGVTWSCLAFAHIASSRRGGAEPDLRRNGALDVARSSGAVAAPARRRRT